MKRVLSLLALGFALTLGTAQAASHAGAAPMKEDGKSAQQNKMTMCNKDAGDKKGDERKKFMSECLKAKPAADAKAADAKPMTQQEKMKACNKEAGDKKGDERKKLMSECLKK